MPAVSLCGAVDVDKGLIKSTTTWSFSIYEGVWFFQLRRSVVVKVDTLHAFPSLDLPLKVESALCLNEI